MEYSAKRFKGLIQRLGLGLTKPKSSLIRHSNFVIRHFLASAPFEVISRRCSFSPLRNHAASRPCKRQLDRSQAG